MQMTRHRPIRPDLRSGLADRDGARGRRASTSGGFGVGVQGGAIEVVAVRDLDDAAEIHHGDRRYFFVIL